MGVCFMCQEDVYDDELIVHVVVKEYTYRTCPSCTDRHFTAKPNLTYMSRVKSSFAYFARHGDSYRVFATFDELFRFITKPDTHYFMCTFGRGALCYLTHFTCVDALNDLKDLRERACRDMWDTMPIKPKEATIYVGKDTFKRRILDDVLHEADQIAIKQQKIENATYI